MRSSFGYTTKIDVRLRSWTFPKDVRAALRREPERKANVKARCGDAAEAAAQAGPRCQHLCSSARVPLMRSMVLNTVSELGMPNRTKSASRNVLFRI